MYRTYTLNSIIALAVVATGVLALAWGLVSWLNTSQTQLRPAAPARAEEQQAVAASIPVPALEAEGLALYQQSERSYAPLGGLGLTAEGLAAYHFSEWGRPILVEALPPHIAHPGR